MRAPQEPKSNFSSLLGEEPVAKKIRAGEKRVTKSDRNETENESEDEEEEPASSIEKGEEETVVAEDHDRRRAVDEAWYVLRVSC